MNFVKKAKARSSRLLKDEFHHLKTKWREFLKDVNKNI